MIILPIFAMQLIHVRVYGACRLVHEAPSVILHHSFCLGESEYWFAMIKVLMIIFFILVGLIYDWGGVRGHPGPVRSHSTRASPELSERPRKPNSNI